MALSFIGLILLLLCGCAAFFFLILGGKMLFNAIGGGTANATEYQQPSGRSHRGVSAVGILLGVALLTAIFAFPILFVVGTSRNQKLAEASMVEAMRATEDARASRMKAQDSVFPNPPIVPAVPTSGETSPEDLREVLTGTISELKKSKNPFIKRFLPTLLKRQDASNSELNEDEADQPLAEAPLERPEWTKQSAADLHVVVSEPRASESAAREQAFARATDLLMADYIEHNNGVGNWRVDPEAAIAIRRQYTEQIPWDFAAGTNYDSETSLEGTAYRTYLQVSTEPRVHGAIYQQWKASASEDRLQTVATASGCMVAAVALLAMFFRIEKRGFVRRGMRMGSLLGAAGLSLGSLVVAAEGLEEPTHIGPARGQAQERPYHSSISNESVESVSSFAGTPVHGRRLGFVIVGDDQLLKDDRITRIAAEISECISRFDSVDYRIYCESSDKPLLQTSGSFQGGSGPSVDFLHRTISSAFPEGATSVFPDRSMQAMFENYRPDQVILICNDTDEFMRNHEQSLQKFLGHGRPVHFFDIDGEQPSALAPKTSIEVHVRHNN